MLKIDSSRVVLVRTSLDIVIIGCGWYWSVFGIEILIASFVVRGSIDILNVPYIICSFIASKCIIFAQIFKILMKLISY